MSDRNNPPPAAAEIVAAGNPPPICRLNTPPGQFGPDNPGKPFPRGHTGRPKGARNTASTMLARMFEGEAEEIGRKAIELAKDGRVTAVKLILDRAHPPRHGRTVEGLKLPRMNTAADAVTAMAKISSALAAGTITIGEARDLSAFIDNFRKTLELADIDRRIEVLEERAKANAAGYGPR